MSEGSKKTKVRKLLSLLSILLIGAAGSGLWDLLFRDFIYSLGNTFVNGISYFYSGYIDSLYSEIGIQYSIFNVLPGITIITIIAISPLMLSFIFYSITIDQNKTNNFRDAILGRNEKFGNFIYRKKFAFRFVFFIASVVILILYFDIGVKAAMNYSAINYLETTIEIVHPSISEEEYLKLKSKYRQIDNKEKFEETLNLIFLYAKRDSLLLPEGNFYGVKLNNTQ